MKSQSIRRYAHRNTPHGKADFLSSNEDSLKRCQGPSRTTLCYHKELAAYHVLDKRSTGNKRQEMRSTMNGKQAILYFQSNVNAARRLNKPLRARVGIDNYRSKWTLYNLRNHNQFVDTLIATLPMAKLIS